MGRRYAAGARRAAALECLNRAFGDARVSTWTTPQRRDQIHVPAALIAAAGVARLTMAADEVVFDIPTLLDATLAAVRAGGPRLGSAALRGARPQRVAWLKATKSPLIRLSRQL